MHQLGARNPRIDRVRSLRTKKGRREQRRFAFEGLTLLEEALRSTVSIEEVYTTPDRLNADYVRTLNAHNVPIYSVDERTMKKLSDLETPPGVLTVAPIVMSPLAGIFSGDGVVLVLAGLSDPGNAGTLLRAAEAFGARGVVFGTNSVDPHSPKVMRSAMGSLFRLPLAIAGPQETAGAATGWECSGLAAGGLPIAGVDWGKKELLVVGQERHGLGDWEPLCTRKVGIPMAGQVESLNAALAGAIALYEASRRDRNGLVKRV